ncbi:MULTISPECIES: ATP synthase F1 subunit epsilon [Petrotoga]|uniref:ATP synthase epsilon chain n=2 Tax=Petrotoga sibirica TaxID=156202 RepID=A0A855MSR3_9BACT|nr:MULTISPECIES: ATP synthase F1 subunit epsilon [Petrotoga]MBL5981760.1 ATP synthase F1 subunit epsilon [Petrotoga sp. 8T1HF07.NaAc.6.1]PNR93110.1 ATP synthase F1 subunit epsilon [Petrotoga sp. HWHPT.55.6.3]POZ89336.1 ATP synthase F1 subunit epsilon [Petrotoga sibirica DSM 13575]POZ91119.1 ATP synthase F1 subunit epsilon [Petrotoga sp. SL27]RLL82116.1 ATP synthase F1 subunit epsilon [Petrotoga sp. Shatin.DS.tank11.9.2.9.3]
MFKFKVVTPEGVKYEEDVQYVEFKTKEGSMGTLTQRLPIVTSLRIAPVSIKKADNSVESFAIHGGILEMTGEEMTIVTTAAERSEDIDVEAARKAMESAQEQIKATEDQFKKIKLQTRIEKNLLRVNISKRK